MHNCLNCHFNKDLTKTFTNTYEFCDGDIKQNCLMLRKGVYPHEFLDSLKKLDETSLPDKEVLKSNLNIYGKTLK